MQTTYHFSPYKFIKFSCACYQSSSLPPSRTHITIWCESFQASGRQDVPRLNTSAGDVQGVKWRWSAALLSGVFCAFCQMIPHLRLQLHKRGSSVGVIFNIIYRKQDCGLQQTSTIISSLAIVTVTAQQGDKRKTSWVHAQHLSDKLNCLENHHLFGQMIRMCRLKKAQCSVCLSVICWCSVSVKECFVFSCSALTWKEKNGGALLLWRV